MLTVIIIMVAGIVAGRLLRGKGLGGVRAAIMPLIFVLLFLLGLQVGHNPRIIAGLPTLGVEAAAIAVLALLGSMAGAWALWRWVSAQRSQRP